MPKPKTPKANRLSHLELAGLAAKMRAVARVDDVVVVGIAFRYMRVKKGKAQLPPVDVAICDPRLPEKDWPPVLASLGEHAIKFACKLADGREITLSGEAAEQVLDMVLDAKQAEADKAKEGAT